MTLVRTWQTSSENRVTTMTDTWKWTGGGAHTVNARYFDEMHAGAAGGVYEFPGESGFSFTSEGETKTFPAGPGMTLYKTKPSLPEDGDGENPQTAMTFDSAPTEPVRAAKTSMEHPSNITEAPYQRRVPVGGSSSTLRFGFVQSFSMTEARALAAGVIAGYYPSVAITAPPNASTTTSPSVTVSGTASDTIGVSSLSVNGTSAAVGAGGGWSATVPLKAGANTITATAVNQSGLSRSASISVTYAPAPPPPPPPVAHAKQLGTASGARGHVTLTLACAGPTGSSCSINITTSTLEKLRHGKPVALSARAKRVTVGALHVVLAAGRHATLTVNLNALGRRLLTRFKRLPVHLVAKSMSAGSSSTVVAQNLIVRPPARKHHRH